MPSTTTPTTTPEADPLAWVTATWGEAPAVRPTAATALHNAQARTASERPGEALATARSIMRGDATPDERRAQVVATLILSGVLDTPAPEAPTMACPPKRLAFMRLRYEGASIVEASQASGLSVATGKSHSLYIHRTFGAASFPEACVEAVRAGLLPRPSDAEVEAIARTLPGYVGRASAPVEVDPEVGEVYEGPRRRCSGEGCRRQARWSVGEALLCDPCYAPEDGDEA